MFLTDFPKEKRLQNSFIYILMFAHQYFFKYLESPRNFSMILNYTDYIQKFAQKGNILMHFKRKMVIIQQNFKDLSSV